MRNTAVRYKLIVAVLTTSAMLAGVVSALQQETKDVGYVSVDGDMSMTQREEVYRHVNAMASLSDIRAVKQRLDSVDWIHHVDVARDWPDGLIVTVHDEEAIAYWNDDAWINDQGHVFLSAYEDGGRLPHLYGPDGREGAVMSQYQQLSQALLRTGQEIDTLVLDDRGSWTFTTRSGIDVLLGKDNTMERMQRYFRVFRQAGLLEETTAIRTVDTRYSNGVAVEWKDDTEGYEVAKAFKSEREMSL